MVTQSQDGSLPSRWFYISRYPFAFFFVTDDVQKLLNDLNIITGRLQLCMKNIKPSAKIIPEIQSHHLHLRMLLAAKWCTKECQISYGSIDHFKAQLAAQGFNQLNVLTMMKPLVLLSLLPFELFFASPLHYSGLCISSMLKAPFFMGIQ